MDYNIVLKLSTLFTEYKEAVDKELDEKKKSIKNPKSKSYKKPRKK